ncbi:ribonuclease T2 family protein [Xylaria sp. CBS 124048]|nr:ribonuclease T2 family protein [Xylaria sp. CBS 124048]
MQRALALSVLSQGALAALYPGLTTANHTCSLVNPVLSCSKDAQPGLVDTCCTETFGGLILQTQFWNTYTGLESEGQLLPENSWGIHGLWPDFCNGSFTQYCDLTRQFDPFPDPNTTTGTPDGTPVPAWKGEPVYKFLEKFQKFDLLDYMSKHWIALNQPSWTLWAHEFSKHATCFSTFDKECWGPQYADHEEVVQFYETVVTYYRRLPTWRWLAEAGIRPSNTTSYSLAAIQSAISAHHGHLPYVGCTGPRFNETAAGQGSDDDGFTALDEMWYYYHVWGRVQDVQAVPVDASIAGSVSSCATAPGAIWYYERTPSSVRPSPCKSA